MNEDEVMELNEDADWADSCAVLDDLDDQPTEVELEDMVRRGLTCSW